jgi:2-polyprenyl-3-methyl-5-hydroxy-6-metoxy-1,4-benzoquinol methylase
MNHSDANRFQDFFEESKYTLLKNYLYNYLLRKMAVEKSLRHENIKLILEVGSGISPVMTRTNLIIYSDLSFTALQMLKHAYGNGLYVVADCMNLPFKSGAFSHTISSEVLEHLKDDRKALNELSVTFLRFLCFMLPFSRSSRQHNPLLSIYYCIRSFSPSAYVLSSR